MPKVCANEQISDSVIQQNSNGKRRLPATDYLEEQKRNIGTNFNSQSNIMATQSDDESDSVRELYWFLQNW